MSRRTERGVALLAATAALAVLAVLATGLAGTAAVDHQLARHALAALQADALARSGVAAATVVLEESRRDGAPDTLFAPWAQDSGRQRLGAGTVEVRVEDEARRLDLGAPELADAVPRLLAALHMDPGLADAIADWIDADDEPRPHGAERAWYLAQATPYVPANRPLASVGELRLVRGVDAAALARLAPYVTVAGEHAVDPNTAPREVLTAVLGDAGLADRVLAARMHAALDVDTLSALLPELPGTTRGRLAPRAQHFRVTAVAAVGDMARAVEATVFAPDTVAPAVTSWRPLVAPGRRAGMTPES